MKHVLLASLGGSPQVVTETVWAFMNPDRLIDPSHRSRARVVPGVVHLLTTAFFDTRFFGSVAERNAEIEARLGDLYRQYGHRPPKIIFDMVCDAEGQSLEDIRDQRENVLYADHVTARVKSYCDDREVRLHMSLAGGRKSMSSYDHSAMMFFGRAGDTLTHVLVEPKVLEGSPEFWWPDQPAKTIKVRDVDVATTSDLARVDLVDVPFVRLHVRLPSGVPDEALDYRSLVQYVEFEKQELPIVVDAGDFSITVGDQKVKLHPSPFAIFSVLAIAKKQAWSGVGPEEEGQGPNAAGWIGLDDIRCGRDTDGNLRRTRALQVLEAVLDRRADGLKERANGMLEAIRQEVHGGLIEDPTQYERSRLRKQLNDKLASPFILNYILPKSYGKKGAGIFVGLEIPAHRIKLQGFSKRALNTEAEAR